MILLQSSWGHPHGAMVMACSRGQDGMLGVQRPFSPWGALNSLSFSWIGKLKMARAATLLLWDSHVIGGNVSLDWCYPDRAGLPYVDSVSWIAKCTSTYSIYIVRKTFVPAKWVEAEQGSGFISSAMAMWSIKFLKIKIKKDKN